jgi:hypothetical protein
MALEQQRLPWAPLPPAPHEIFVGFRSCGHVVAISGEPPNSTEWKKFGVVRIEKLNAWQYRKTIGHCPCQPLPGEERMTVVKGPPPMQPAPEGTWRAVCVDEVDRGEQPSKFGPRAMVMLVFEIEELNPKMKNQPYLVFANMGASLGKKANLRKFLQAWRGQKFSDEEIEKGFDLEKLVGACCQLQIVHNHADTGEIYANIESVMPLAKGQEKLKPSGTYTRYKDRKDNSGPARGEPAPLDDDGFPIDNSDIPF